MNQPVTRDERYFAVENASFKIGYLILAFGTMLLIAVRGLLFQESHWDFFALVWVSSAAATVYQYRHRIVTFDRRYLLFVLGVTLLSAAVAVLAVLLAR